MSRQLAWVVSECCGEVIILFFLVLSACHVSVVRSGQIRSVTCCRYDVNLYKHVRPDKICDLLQVSCKPVLTCSMVRLSETKPSPSPDFMVRRVYDMDTQQDEEQNVSKSGGAPYEPTTILM